MNSNRIWVIGGVLVTIVVLALGGLLGVKPQLDAAANSNDQRASVETLNEQHRRDLASLKEEFKQVDQIAAQVADLRKSVPASSDLDSIVAELAAMQAVYGVTVISYSSSDPATFLASEEIAAAVPASVNGSNFLTVGLSIGIAGPRDAMLAFVNGMQTNPRLMLVNSLNVSDEDETVITAVVYVLLDTPLIDPNAVVTPAPTATAAE